MKEILIDTFREDIVHPDGRLVAKNVLFVRAIAVVSWHVPVFAEEFTEDAKEIVQRKVIESMRQLIRKTSAGDA